MLKDSVERFKLPTQVSTQKVFWRSSFEELRQTAAGTCTARSFCKLVGLQNTLLRHLGAKIWPLSLAPRLYSVEKSSVAP
eukprot:scaffold542561_cov50-Prasinocladus_malaysianus.AAC.1